MTWKDKLEIGLKPDAPYRKDNLPDQQVRGPELEQGDGRSPVVPAAAGDRTVVPAPVPQPRQRNREEATEDSSVPEDETEAVWAPDDSEHERDRNR